MNRKQIGCVAGAVAGAAVVAFWYIQRRAETTRSTHDWGDPAQPKTGAAGQPTGGGFPVSPDPVASFHAVRPGSPRLQAGSRLMRTYPATLVDDPESLVR